MKALLMALGLLVATAALTACGPSSGGPGGGPDLPDGEGARQLLLLGDAFRTVAAGDEVPIEVRYLRENGAVIPFALVELEVTGELAGAHLSARAAETDADGLASVVLRAGEPSRLTVTASAAGAEPVTVTVDVIAATFGELQVTVSYRGARAVRSAEVGLFANATCAEVVRRTISASAARQVLPGGVVTFERVEIGSPLAVFGVGVDRNGFVAADGCIDERLEGPSRIAELVLEDWAETFGGTYDVVETFDVTSGMSSGLDALLEAMTGLSGDPAQYIVSFVASSDEVPSWLRSALSNPIMAAVVTSTLRGAIESVEIPGLLRSTLGLGADLDRALSGLVLRGELVMGEPDEFSSSAATHRLTAMEVPVDGATHSRPVRTEAGLTVTFGDELGLPEHHLALAFGSLVETILNEILLPRLPGSPHSIGELTREIFDCAAIARALVGDDSLAATLANAVCDAGVGILAASVQDLVLGLAEYDDLALSGSLDLSDRDGDYDRDAVSGMLQAAWTGADGALEFAGTMTGTLRGDTSGRSHPIRERLRTLF